MSGFLAIWSDLEPAAETDYLHWFSREHSMERVGIPGFLAVRIFRALDVPVRRYFILYELENDQVVSSEAYLARLNQPTAWSKRIMPILGNFARGGGRIAALRGKGHGGFVTALKLDAEATAEAATLAEAVASHDRIAAARVLATDHARTGVKTSEKSLRDQDRSFDGLLVIEGLDAASVRHAAAALAQVRPALAGEARNPTVYETVFSLDKRML
jgi:hypothetical protein